jgi:CMP-N-acetylneuraminic acid synthetase
MQRAGKTHRASGAENGSAMKEMLFFKACKQALEEYGHDDAAFYFEQIEEHLRNGGTLDQNKAGNILGV